MYCPSNRSADRLDGQYIQRNENARRLATNFDYFLLVCIVENGPAALLDKKSFHRISPVPSMGLCTLGLMKNGAKLSFANIVQNHYQLHNIGLNISNLVQGDYHSLLYNGSG